MPLLVLKLGGSLLPWPGLPAALAAFLDAHPPPSHRLVLLVGGGAIVDALRSLDQSHAIGQERSHALALRAMDLTAHVAAALVPGLVAVETIDALAPAWHRGETPVLAPRQFLDADDRTADAPLPHHWDVTSDSIAARLAVRLGADGLILLKSTDAPPLLDRDAAASLGLVDPAFPAASRPIPRVSLVNLRNPNPEPVALLPSVFAPTPRRSPDY